MTASLLLDNDTHDLVLDAASNIAVCTEPYSLAQDAGCACITFLGECYFDTTIGVPWLQILGQRPNIQLVKAQLVAAALASNPDIASAAVYLSALNERSAAGQVQVSSSSTTAPVAAPFAVTNPQGA